MPLAWHPAAPPSASSPLGAKDGLADHIGERETSRRIRAALDAVRPSFEVPPTTRLVGVAGTVTQLAALKAGIPVYDPDVTHHAVLSHGDAADDDIDAGHRRHHR